MIPGSEFNVQFSVLSLAIAGYWLLATGYLFCEKCYIFSSNFLLLFFLSSTIGHPGLNLNISTNFYEIR